MRVIILIINYNNTDDLKNCIQSCLQLSFHDFQILVIENGSSDDTIFANSTWLQSMGLVRTGGGPNLYSDKIRYVVNDKNLGFGNGNNFGIDWIEKNIDQPDYIWLLNNDTELDANALSHLVEAMDRNQSVGFAGSLIMDFEQRNVIQAAGGKFLPWFGVTTHLLKGKSKDHVTFDNLKSDYQCGASILVRYPLIKQYGGFNPDFFLYFEESDWQCRMSKFGWSNILVPNSEVYHKEGTSTRSLPGYFFYHYFYSAVRFSRINFGLAQNIIGFFSLLLLLILRSKFNFLFIKEGLKGIYFALSKSSNGKF
jgi:GT2 family glycosyltransferase